MDNFHFHFSSDADILDTNRHFLEYEYRIFWIIHYQFPPLASGAMSSSPSVFRFYIAQNPVKQGVPPPAVEAGPTTFGYGGR